MKSLTRKQAQRIMFVLDTIGVKAFLDSNAGDNNFYIMDVKGGHSLWVHMSEAALSDHLRQMAVLEGFVIKVHDTSDGWHYDIMRKGETLRTSLPYKFKTFCERDAEQQLIEVYQEFQKTKQL